MDEPRFTRRIPDTQSEVRPAEREEVQEEDAFDLAVALGSETRWKIVRTLADDTCTIQELTEKVSLTKGTVSVHVQQLEDAGVIGSRFNISDSGGVEKEVALVVDEVVLKLSDR